MSSSTATTNNTLTVHNSSWFNSTFVPFHHLAEKIRGRPEQEVVETFKALTWLIYTTHDVWRMRQAPEPDVDEIECFDQDLEDEFKNFERKKFTDQSDGVQEPRAHLLSTLDRSIVTEFFAKHVSLISGNPEYVIYRQYDSKNRQDVDISAAQHWLVNCVLHLECDHDGGLRQIWGRYVDVQPRYQARNDALERYEVQVAENSHHHRVHFPGLAHTLEPFTGSMGEILDDEAVMFIVELYATMGSTAAYIWNHVREHHDLPSTQALSVDDNHVKMAISRCEEMLDCRIADWRSPIALVARYLLSQINIGADFLFLQNFVCRRVLDPDSRDGPLELLTTSMTRYILDAINYQFDLRVHSTQQMLALGPSSGIVTRLATIRRQWMGPPASQAQRSQADLRNTISDEDGLYHIPQSLVSFYIDTPNFQDVQFEAYGPLLDINTLTEAGVPEVDSLCTICQNEYSTDESCPCVCVNVCKHLFHSDCLHAWVNSLQTAEKVLCPNCRAAMCDARPRRPIPG